MLEHWDNGVPVLIPLSGKPPLELRVDPPRQRLTLRAPVSSGIDLPTNLLAHVRLELIAEGSDRFIEISTTDERLIADGYSMLIAVADRIQLEGADPVTALRETLETWRSILAMRVRMTDQVEVGLFGELLVVEALELGDMNTSSWRGGLSEEHDFGFLDADVEVKTTVGERRQHWIHGLGQLTPTGETALWLLSVQITRGGADQGRTLPDLIDDVIAATPDETARTRLHDLCTEAGWREEQRDLFDDRWRLRSAPLAVEVNETFPRLTAQHLSRAKVDAGAIRRVNYEIDLTDRSPSPARPASLSAILQHIGAGDG